MALRGATCVFVDIDDATGNIDPDAVAAAITDATKAVVAMHYGGVAAEMDRLLDLADERSSRSSRTMHTASGAGGWAARSARSGRSAR